mgnify:CR=1 FL=1
MPVWQKRQVSVQPTWDETQSVPRSSSGMNTVSNSIPGAVLSSHLRVPSGEICSVTISGRASVLTFTLNHQPWVPAPDHPYAIAIVGIEEQPGLRLMTNVVNCPPEAVRIGMAVRVVFEPHDDVHVPLFEPAGA